MMIDSVIDFTKIDSNIEVLVIDTETRHLSSAAAYRVVFSIVKQASEIGIPYIYKKTDSALRGNIGAELAAAVHASGKGHINFIPAFPQMNRTTANGIHYINGVPLAQSVFGNDPFEPVRYSDIKEIIASQSEIETHIIGNKAAEAISSANGVLVYDSGSKEDIENIAAELIKKDEMHLIAGCAGFASILPKALKLGGKQPQMPELSTNMLIVCGSVNPVSVAQCDYAESKGAPRYRLIPEQKLNPGWAESKEADEFVRKLHDSCEKNPIVILDSNDIKGAESTAVYAQKRGIESEQMRTRIMSVMGRLLERLLDAGFNGTVFIMGGDSLIGFIHQAGIKAIFPVCELDCGVVLSQLERNGKALNVISKSGGFGKETLFGDLSKMLLKLNEGK
ncbi:MAG TPA: hypothetical protein DCP97_03270 [Ruminococcaceae bacterium]|nr:hypothetical protein [Oscillospiraceae bacterium]